MNLSNASKSIVVLVVCLAAMVIIQSAGAGEKGQFLGSGGNLITSVPRTMSYQGILKDSGGDPVTDSVYNVTFRIFNAESGGTSLWEEMLPCTTSEGYFSAVLGSVNLAFDEDYWLEIEVGGEILDPRQKMNMVGYAAVSDTADYAFATAAGGNGWVDDGTVVSLDTGTDSVGIGTTTPSEKLDVAGRAQLNGFKMPTGASDGYVLTSDSNGVGTWQSAPGGNAWVLTGNAGTTPGTHFVGTTDNQALEFHVNNNRALRLEPNEQLGSPITANVIGGSWGNTVTAGMAGATICGGGGTGDYINQVTYSWGFVGGGNGNTAAGNAATVGGGALNLSSGSGSTVAGGYSDSATAYAAAVGGGYRNLASGQYSTVSGGLQNTASGHYSFAAGRRARAIHDGAFVWGDNTDANFTSSAHGQFNVRASGGTRIYSNSGLTAGVTLAAGASSWASVSDSTLKRNIRPVDGDDILEKLSRLPISRWSYKAQDESIEHIGPMAQDFYRLFNVGFDDKHINTLDLDGIALAAIKGLCEMNQQQKAQLDQQAEEISNLKDELLRLTMMVGGKASIE